MLGAFSAKDDRLPSSSELARLRMGKPEALGEGRSPPQRTIKLQGMSKQNWVNQDIHVTLENKVQNDIEQHRLET
jgi:hypothetical protein